jgi:hypothetical protein
MSNLLDEHRAPTAVETAQAAGRLARGVTVRNLARKARAAQLSGNALLAAGLSLTVLAAATVLWAGIVTGAGRVVVLILAAGLIRLRLLAVRLGGMTPADGMNAPPPSRGLIRWLNPIESAVLMVAGGLNAFGSGSDIAPILGVVAGLMVLLASARRRTSQGVHEPSRPHPTTLLAITCLVATFSPLWGWRGQTLIIGLCVISVVLAVQIVWKPRRAAG